VSVDGPIPADAVTDASGRYTLQVPAGNYRLTAADYGFTGSAAQSVAVTAGATTVSNVTLKALPSAVVSGVVTDGSGHGWPLYASVAVAGMPGAPVYTNPYTGAYRLAVPRGHSYTLQVTPEETGYQATSVKVSAGSSTVRRDVSVPVDQASCTAPGYTQQVSGPTQTFDGTAAPAGWTTNGWAFDDPSQRGNHTGGSGGFAIADTGSSTSAVQDTLTSAPIGVPDVPAPTLAFNSDVGGSGIVAIGVSSDGGADWTSIWSDSSFEEPLGGPQFRTVALPSGLAGTSVMLQFTFATFGGSANQWWAIDNVAVGALTCAPVAAGLVAGTIGDATTGLPLDGASLGAGATGPQPRDPAHPHGL
jgi:hypothetical protein